MNVDVKGYGMDRYNLILVVLFIEEKNVNLEMVRAGFPEVYESRFQGSLLSLPIWKLKRNPDAKEGNVDPGGKVCEPQGVLEESVHFLQKPFSMKDLAGRVRETLDTE